MAALVVRAVVAGCLLLAVTVGGFVYGAINTITKATWPDFEET
jgi:hypothetical protein